MRRSSSTPTVPAPLRKGRGRHLGEGNYFSLHSCQNKHHHALPGVQRETLGSNALVSFEIKGNSGGSWPGKAALPRQARAFCPQLSQTPRVPFSFFSKVAAGLKEPAGHRACLHGKAYTSCPGGTSSACPGSNAALI